MEHCCLVGMESAVLHCKEWSFWPSAVDLVPRSTSCWDEAVFCLLLGRRRALNATITRQELKCSFCGLWSHCPCHHHRHHHHGMNGIQPKQHLGRNFNTWCWSNLWYKYYMCKRCRFHIVMNGIQANRASRLLFQIFIARPRIPQRALLVFSRQPPPGGKICPGWIALQCKLNWKYKNWKSKSPSPQGVKSFH